MTDPYQQRYAAHQARKREVLMGLIVERHSDRVFSDRTISREHIDAMHSALTSCASSCVDFLKNRLDAASMP